MKFYLCLDNFSELWNLFSRVSMGNCFLCYSRQLLISLALRKCKKDCKIPKILLVQGFCPLNAEIAWFSTEFCLNLFLLNVNQAYKTKKLRALDLKEKQSKLEFLDKVIARLTDKSRLFRLNLQLRKQHTDSIANQK